MTWRAISSCPYNEEFTMGVYGKSAGDYGALFGED
jgi:hypothetical protein